MIRFDFTLANPFVKPKFDEVFSKRGKLSEYKFWVFNIYKNSTIISAEISTRDSFIREGTPLSVYISACLFGYEFVFDLYDTRYWNCETGSWDSYVIHEGDYEFNTEAVDIDELRETLKNKTNESI